MVESRPAVFRLAGLHFASAARTAWKKPTSSRMPSASSCGTASANALDSSVTALQQPVLAVLLREDVLLRRRQQRQPLRRRAASLQADQSKPWNRSQQTSYFSSITATASSWSIAVLPVPPLSV